MAERRLGRALRAVGSSHDEEWRSPVVPFTADVETVLKDQLAIHETMKNEQGKVVPLVFHRDGERIKYFRAAWANA